MLRCSLAVLRRGRWGTGLGRRRRGTGRWRGWGGEVGGRVWRALGGGGWGGGTEVGLGRVLPEGVDTPWKRRLGRRCRGKGAGERTPGTAEGTRPGLKPGTCRPRRLAQVAEPAPRSLAGHTWAEGTKEPQEECSLFLPSAKCPERLRRQVICKHQRMTSFLCARDGLCRTLTGNLDFYFP